MEGAKALKRVASASAAAASAAGSSESKTGSGAEDGRGSTSGEEAGQNVAGMANAGKSRTCDVVPMDHVGPVPG